MVNPLVRVNMRNTLNDYKVKHNINIGVKVNIDNSESLLLKSIIHGKKGVAETKQINSIISLDEAAKRIKNGL